MGSHPLKLIWVSALLGIMMLVGLVDVAAAAAPAGRPVPVDPLAGVSSQVITLPTPFPTPAAVTYTQELETAFWDVTNYEGAVSAFQTLFLLEGIQDIIVIFTWLGIMAISFALIRGIIAGATSKPAADNEEGV